MARPLHVGFLAWGDKVYQPGVKVTLDLAESLAPLGAQSSVVVVHGGPDSLAEARRLFGNSKVREASSPATLVAALRELGPDVVFSKDHIDSLSMLRTAKKALGVKTVSFTSGFYGLDTLTPPHRELPTSTRRPASGMRKYLPFPRVTRRYRDLLRELSGTVAISYYCEMILEFLYGVRPLGVVYPVVDPVRYHPAAPSKVRSGVLVFAGPAGNRAPASFLPILEKIPDSAGPIHLFGAHEATEELHRGLGPERSVRHVDISNEELVRLYQNVKATYITSEWEGFGYVGPESLLCGTPVVTEVAQPWMELTGESEFVRIARRPKDIIESLSSPPEGGSKALDLRAHLAQELSPHSAGTRLLNALSLI